MRIDHRRRLCRPHRRSPSCPRWATLLGCLVALALLTSGCTATPLLPLASLSQWEPAATAQALPAPPAPGTVGSLQIYYGSVMLPTYPYERYQTPAYDAQYRWRYLAFDYERFRNDAPQPTLRTYRTLTLENQYLRLIILPELGGRLWRVVHKPSGDDLFYHNAVVMPSPWGPTDMGGWLALGGLEWDLPVAEHGYAWGIPWQITALENDGRRATVTLSLPRNGQVLEADVEISLRDGEAAFGIAPTIRNASDAPVHFAFWTNAALAPGKANRPSADTRFAIPGASVTVHSTDDPRLPAPGQALAWPWDMGRDLSRLGNWQGYLGFFERPAAHGPFVGVYDEAQDAGVVRVFPANIARGSKVFGLGYRTPLDHAYYTADGSAYVELHGGLAPTFDDQVTLAAHDSVHWEEQWYPVTGIGSLRTANRAGALTWEHAAGGLHVGFYPTAPLQGTLVVEANGRELARQSFDARPDAPFVGTLKLAGGQPLGSDVRLTLRVENSAGTPLLVADETILS